MRNMTLDEFEMLIEIINEKHLLVKGACVKYVIPNFDMRTGDIFSVNIRGFGWEETLHTVNENRDNPLPLLDVAVQFLNKKAIENGYVEPIQLTY